MDIDHYASLSRRIKGTDGMQRLTRLYGSRECELVNQIARYTQLLKRHEEDFHASSAPILVSAPGRAEIAGNHTDHNRGKVLAAAVTLDTVAAVTPRGDSLVRVNSEGYPPIELTIDNLSPVEAEKNTSAAIIRGIAARMREKGFRVGGFDAAVVSSVPSGSGLSSSAAFEVLICAIFDALYNGFTVDPVLRAQIAQYAENNFFGKPCGLMDQTASSVGGLVTIDFKNEPVVTPLQFQFAQAGYDMVVVCAGGSHDNLTAQYAAIREEMQKVAACFGEQALRRVRPEQLLQALPEVRKKAGDRAVLRAMHFFNENARVSNQVQALKKNDLPAFFASVIASGQSSWTLLQNVYADNTCQPLSIALALAADLLTGKGAWRVHGGGFAGTTLNFVPCDLTPRFISVMESAFGQRCCSVIDVRPEGAAIVLE